MKWNSVFVGYQPWQDQNFCTTALSNAAPITFILCNWYIWQQAYREVSWWIKASRWFSVSVPSRMQWSNVGKHGYIGDKRSRVKSYPYPVKKGQRYINLNPPGRVLFSSHPKRERDREAHLNYYASTYNRRQLSHCKTNTTQTSMTKNYTQHKINTQKLKPGLVASYDIRHGNGVRLFW